MVRIGYSQDVSPTSGAEAQRVTDAVQPWQTSCLGEARRSKQFPSTRLKLQGMGHCPGEGRKETHIPVGMTPLGAERQGEGRRDLTQRGLGSLGSADRKGPGKCNSGWSVWV